MVCPCRVILAALSAFVAVFLVWHTTRESPQSKEGAADDTNRSDKVRLIYLYSLPRAVLPMDLR